MKAQIIKSSTGVVAKFENGVSYTKEEGETLKDFKARIQENVEEKVSFKNVNLKNEMTEALQERLLEAEGVEADAVAEELANREADDDLEGPGDEVSEDDDLEGPEENAGGVVAEDDAEADDDLEGPGDEAGDEAEKTALELAKEKLNGSLERLAAAKGTVKEKVEAAKTEVAENLNTAKAALELAKIDTEQAVNEAETAYSAARRAVAMNNLNQNEVEKTDEEKAADAAALTECKEALDSVKSGAKEAIQTAKDSLAEIKDTVKSKVEEVKEACKAELEAARTELEESKDAYNVVLQESKAEAEETIVEAEAELEAAGVALEEAKKVMEKAKADQKAAKDKLQTSKRTLKSSPNRGTSTPNVSLVDAEAEREVCRKHQGTVIAFVPSTGGEPITGTIKAVVLDKRVMLVYYRIIGCNNADEALNGKMFHKRVTGFDVEAATVETVKEA